MHMLLNVSDYGHDLIIKEYTFFASNEILSQEIRNQSALTIQHEDSNSKTKDDTVMLQSEDYQQL